MLFQKSSLPKMPPSDWKKCFTEKTNLEAKKKEVNRIDAPKKKPIKKISEKKKKRLKENGSEADLFRNIIAERGELYCEVCGKHIKNPKPHNFDHKIPKSRGEKYRLDKNNIQILCFAHHFEKTTGLKYKGIDLD